MFHSCGKYAAIRTDIKTESDYSDSEVRGIKPAIPQGNILSCIRYLCKLLLVKLSFYIHRRYLMLAVGNNVEEASTNIHTDFENKIEIISYGMDPTRKKKKRYRL